MPLILSGDTGVPVTTVTGTLPVANGGTGGSTPVDGFKNRIINGAMVIDQRNAGASVTITNTVALTYTLDRILAYGAVASKFSIQQNAGAVTPPVGFTKYLGCTSLSAYSVGASDAFIVGQAVEGLNITDLAWGTANASSITLSFKVYSSLTGTFGGSIYNADSTRSYPFSYSIPVANTWTTISITIPGDATGAWATDNTAGIQLVFSLGSGSTVSGTAGAWAGASYRSATGATSVVGTNGATFYITGVQLEKGSTATSFDYRPYGTELALCQRYYEKSYEIGTVAGTSTNTGKGTYVMAAGNGYWRWTQLYQVPKRTASTFTIYSTTGASGNVRLNNSSNVAVSTEDASEHNCNVYVSYNAAVTDFFWWQWVASAEL